MVTKKHPYNDVSDVIISKIKVGTICVGIMTRRTHQPHVHCARQYFITYEDSGKKFNSFHIPFIFITSKDNHINTTQTMLEN